MDCLYSRLFTYMTNKQRWAWLIVWSIFLFIAIDIAKNCHITRNVFCDTEKCVSQKLFICKNPELHSMGWGTSKSFLPIKIKNLWIFITDGNIHISKWETIEIDIKIDKFDQFTRIDWWDGSNEKSSEHTFKIPWNYTITAGSYMWIIDGPNIVQYAKVIVSDKK